MMRPANQPEKIGQPDSFLPTIVLAHETVIFFTCWLIEWEMKYHEF